MFVINGVVWAVKIVRPDHPLLRQPNGNFALGVCDSRQQLICISNQLKGLAFKETLCHEIVHAAVFSYGVTISHAEEEFLAKFIAKYGRELITVTDKVFKQMKRGRI
jgi:hypothetical protein